MARLQVVVADLNEFIDKVMIKLALDVVENLASAPSEGGTPIDTGWASANWIPSIGSPARGTAGSRPVSGKNVASRSAQEQGSAAVATGFKNPGKIVISNNVPYILDLNDGNSAQAPSGFVQRAIIQAVAVVAGK